MVNTVDLSLYTQLPAPKNEKNTQNIYQTSDVSGYTATLIGTALI
jgi:hypothetical protein